ncbi:MAG: Asp-tRNA(Asn)/Glu-tRNA(Gln) amidotransferase subunit GatC [Myxococcales bacterium]
MAIDRAQVRKVARLARLSLTEAEEATFATQLSHVLDYIETLAAVDVGSIEPLAFAGDAPQAQAGGAAPADGAALRPDEARPGVPRDEALAAAPSSNGAFFLVPRILE